MIVLNKTEATLVRAQITSHISALHNWIATAVETGKAERAATLVTELRDHQLLFSKLNRAIGD